MKVGYICDALKEGWYPTFLMESMLENSEDEFFGFTFEEGKNFDSENIEIYSDNTPKNYLFKIPWRSWKNNIDLMHIQFEFGALGNFYGSIFLLPLLIILKSMGIKVVVTAHGPIFPTNDEEIGKLVKPDVPLSSLFIPYMKYTYRIISTLADRIIVHAKIFKEWYVNHFPGREDKVEVIPHGVKIKDIEDVENGGINFISFGILTPRKNLETLIEAFEKASGGKKDWNLTIAGGETSYYEGYKDKLMERTKECGIENKMKFTGYVPQEEVDDVFAKADVFVQPSKFRTAASGPIFQAIGYKIPIIATSIPFFEEFLEDENNALLAEPNAEDIAREMKKLGEDGKLRGKISKNLGNLRSKYSWKKISKKTLSLYEKIDK